VRCAIPENQGLLPQRSRLSYFTVGQAAIQFNNHANLHPHYASEKEPLVRADCEYPLQTGNQYTDDALHQAQIVPGDPMQGRSVAPLADRRSPEVEPKGQDILLIDPARWQGVIDNSGGFIVQALTCPKQTPPELGVFTGAGYVAIRAGPEI
jgi:hypothetical protein